MTMNPTQSHVTRKLALNAKYWLKTPKTLMGKSGNKLPRMHANLEQKFHKNTGQKCTLMKTTKNKLIIECTKDTLWGTGLPLKNEK